jgi:HK97 gp10 family phage protein
MAKVFVTGVKELDAQLKLVEANVGRKAGRKATREGAKIVAADAKRLVAHDTGLLESSIKVRALKKQRTRFGHGVAMGAEYVAEGLPHYGRFVELGTKYMDADPFLRPALYGNANEVHQTFRQVLGAELRKIRPKK